ncbi:MAG: ferredoxin--NADP(+) reductase [Gammaproteobacteria bacterium]|nr:MAG: ferredoxin--NADP(+) reductase [Gammaproteobacteria bacterium]
MASLHKETVLSVNHWTESLFSFTTSRNPSFRFQSGQFTMMGIEHNDRPLLRAYSIVSAHYQDQLEFFSIKVPSGGLTSQLKNIEVGDEVLVNSKATGSLLQDQLLPGKHLYLLSTGTGLAPFLSIIQDPDVYQRYDKIILTHCCRHVEDLAYGDLITKQLPEHELLGELVREKLLYYPTVTREDFHTQGRLTALLESGKISQDLGLPPLDPQSDRFMICGGPAMLKELSGILQSLNFRESRSGQLGEFVVERAFADQ